MDDRHRAARRLQRHSGDAAAERARRPRPALAPEEIFVRRGLLRSPAAYARVRGCCCAAHFGRVVVAVRENELRAELLGYDVRLSSSRIFTLGGLLAGLAGVLFANCVFVSPTMFSLAYSGAGHHLGDRRRRSARCWAR